MSELYYWAGLLTLPVLVVAAALIHEAAENDSDDAILGLLLGVLVLVLTAIVTYASVPSLVVGEVVSGVCR